VGLCPTPHWGSLQHSPDSLAVFRGPTSKARKGEEGGEGKAHIEMMPLNTPLLPPSPK